jgi:ATP-dependent RNA helicase DeaD
MTSEKKTSAFDILPEVLKENLNDMGILNPTPIQNEALKPVIDGKDLLGLSHTGSGKTLAFLLPMAVRLMGSKGLRAIVLTPTRELAEQVGKVFSTALANTGLRQLVITGGASYQRQRDSLRQGVDVVIGTPGRVVDLMNQGTLDLKSISMFVLDEVDEMLDVGFAEDIDLIRKSVPATAQTVFFSATMGPRTRRVADKILKNAVELKISSVTSTSTIQHEYILVESSKTLSALVNNLIYEDPEQAIVFCETKAQCSDLADLLRARGIPSQAINSDLGQNDRRRTLDEFRSGRLRYLIATNVAARGIDIVGLPLVVNMEPPRNRDSYTHRAGRTGRAGASGRVWTMLTPGNQRKYHSLMRDISVSASALSLPSKGDILLKFASNELEKMKSSLAAVSATPSESEALARSAVERLKPEEAVAILTGLLTKNIKRLNLDTVSSLSSTDRGGARSERSYSGRSEGRGDDRKRSYGRSSSSDYAPRRESGRDGGRDSARDSGREFARPRRLDNDRPTATFSSGGGSSRSDRYEMSAEAPESRSFKPRTKASDRDGGSTFPEGKVYLTEKRDSPKPARFSSRERSITPKDLKAKEPFGKKAPRRFAPKK